MRALRCGGTVVEHTGVFAPNRLLAGENLAQVLLVLPPWWTGKVRKTTGLAVP